MLLGRYFLSSVFTITGKYEIKIMAIKNLLLWDFVSYFSTRDKCPNLIFSLFLTRRSTSTGVLLIQILIL